jgi:hypothetical protein
MPTATYTALANITLSSTVSTVTLSSIPSTYRDLILVCSLRATVANQLATFRLNGDTGSNYSYVSVTARGNDLTASPSGTGTSAYATLDASPPSATNAQTLSTIQFMDYSATDKHKTYLSRADGVAATFNATEALAQRWANTSAITSIVFSMTSGSFVSGATFALYGIAS